MKNIISRKEFLNETVNYYFGDFKRLIQDFIEENSLHYISFSSGKYFKHDYKSDIKKLDNWLIRLTKHDLDWFMNEFKNEIYSDNFFTNCCGFLDSLLYTYDQSFPLSGNILQDYGAGDEYVIKYNYGYMNYDLGKKYILQKYHNLEDFYYDCADNLIKSLAEGINVFSDDYFDYMDEESVKKLEFSTTDKLKNGSICVIDLEKLSNMYKYDINDIEDDIIERLGTDIDYKCGIKMIIIAFGEVNLDLITLDDFYEYKEKIEIQTDTNKYNL